MSALADFNNQETNQFHAERIKTLYSLAQGKCPITHESLPAKSVFNNMNTTKELMQYIDELVRYSDMKLDE